MQYLGSKARIAKPLAAYLESQRQPGQVYWEPFLGHGHVLWEMSGERIGSDIHEDLILMWQAAQQGWMPPEAVSEDEYQALRTAEPSPLRGYVGFQCSFGGKWFGGYARDPKKPERNYAKNGHRDFLACTARASGVVLKCQSYLDFMPTGWLIYCDPPYEATTQFKDRITHTDFWQWCREASWENNVFISSYAAPPDFDVVWSAETRTQLEVTGGGKAKRTERLYTHTCGHDVIVKEGA